MSILGNFKFENLLNCYCGDGGGDQSEEGSGPGSGTPGRDSSGSPGGTSDPSGFGFGYGATDTEETPSASLIAAIDRDLAEAFGDIDAPGQGTTAAVDADLAAAFGEIDAEAAATGTPDAATIAAVDKDLQDFYDYVGAPEKGFWGNYFTKKTGVAAAKGYASLGPEGALVASLLSASMATFKESRGTDISRSIDAAAKGTALSSNDIANLAEARNSMSPAAAQAIDGMMSATYDMGGDTIKKYSTDVNKGIEEGIPAKAGAVGAKQGSPTAAPQKTVYDEARELAGEQYEQTRADLSPWREAGTKALTERAGRIFEGPGDYRDSPGYLLRRETGKRAVDESGIVKTGILGKETTRKALSEYGDDYGTGEYQPFLDRYYKSLKPLQSLSAAGKTATLQTGVAGQKYLQSAGANILSEAATKASGYLTDAERSAKEEEFEAKKLSEGITDVGEIIAYNYGS